MSIFDSNKLNKNGFELKKKKPDDIEKTPRKANCPCKYCGEWMVTIQNNIWYCHNCGKEGAC